MGWQVVLAAGGPRERGRAYGAQAAERVRTSIALYQQIFSRRTGLKWDAILTRAGAFVDAIDAFDVELLPEIEGIAEGAGVPAEHVLAINLRTELMYGLDARGRGASNGPGVRECTAIAVAGEASADGHVLLAQNWDWSPVTRQTCIVLACAPHDRPGFVTVVEAGLLAKCGANEAGVGVGTNALVSSLDRCEPGVPFHAILRRALTSHTLDEAEDIVRRGPRSSSANYLLGSREGRVVNLETAPGGPDLALTAEAPALIHTNHFTWPSPRPFKDIGRIGSDDSIRRLTRARSAIAAGSITVASIQELLRDHEGHPASVCAHEEPGIDPAEDGATIASVVMDVSAGGLWVSAGNPCEVSYERIGLADLLAAARGVAGAQGPAVPERTA